MNDGVLHEANESRAGSWLPKSGLVSLLDILGGGSIACDRCGRWQSFSSLTPGDARDQLRRYGWTFTDGHDVCPRCSALPKDEKASA